MSTNATGQLVAHKGITAPLVLACLFLFAANFSTWKANTTSTINIRTSAIGAAAVEALSQAAEQPTLGKLNLNPDELANRIALPGTSVPYLTLPVATGVATLGNIDEVSITATGFTLRGWIYLNGGIESPEYVIAVENGKAVGAMKVSINRPDVAKALNDKSALRTGYDGQVNAPLNLKSCNISLFTLTSSLTLYPMPSVCAKAEATTH
ncbi:hypothetical protein [Pseudomonas sp. NPDC088444]|uniref:hypothetical protein n=1 Tax=Pseudomonas sp. NPDC088444 TaxID=3364456 RepID=UPI00384AB2F9